MLYDIETSLPKMMEPEWASVLREEFERSYLLELASFVKRERASEIPIYPPRGEVFNALKSTSFSSVKVVIIGQDPYHGERQAHGLSFSVAKGVRTPPSLKNIYKELINDVAIPPPEHGCLESWACQGVLLLNATLTVRGKTPRSHYGKGWEIFTDKIVEKLIERGSPLVFLLWGRSAKEKILRILRNRENNDHLILTSPHPSPYSAHTGFFGCNHFSKTNQFLISKGLAPIDWTVR
ncbi:uracil-DNA glycosylase [Simkania negevensis]|uniref:Uracil-DNA glycosylase n=1 Tax=Simkania negevensis TaxID=83561 RepID=A0ABS3AT81_9BACT|nr:uracil-DNA glycosylase [Simkania negevensis]